MFASLSSFLRSRKLLPRMILGAIGAVAAIAVIKVVEARAEELPPESVTAILESVSPELVAVLSDSFPSDYAAFTADLERDMAGGGDLKATTARHLLALRAQYAPSIAQASDAALMKLARSTGDFYAMLNWLAGPDVCARYATVGAAAVAGSDLENSVGRPALALMATMLATARDGRDHPVTRRAATDAEWQAVASQSLTLGATTDGFSAMAQGIADPGVCPSLVAFLEATQVDGAASLVRAEILTLLSTGE